MFAMLDGMRDCFTIGQLAVKAGVQTSTLRYYERVNLLEPSGRTEGNYRFYGPETLARVRFIRVAQAAGFSLADITTLLSIRDGDTAPCAEVEHLIEHRLSEVRKRLKDLREVDRHLKRFLAMCHESDEKDLCEVLEQLREKSSKP